MSRARPLPRLARGLPWPARAILGIAALALGLFLIGRPLDSLDVLTLYLAASFVVLGVTQVSRGDRDAVDLVIGAAWLALGLVVLLSPGHAITALPTVIGISLLVAGALKLWRVRSGSLDTRLSSLLLGLTQIALGALALSWEDVTLVIAAALFGVMLIVSGASFAAEAILHRDRDRTEAARERGVVRRWGRVLGSAVALLVSIALLVVSGALRDGTPHVDEFYATPDDVPSSPGELLRYEDFKAEIPDRAKAWRILYTTTDALGKPTVASGIVMVPNSPADDPRPVIAWAHGTTGYARQCAPSLLSEPFTAGAFPAVMGQVVDNGWAVVATDYAGLGTEGYQPYIIGRGEAYSVLDTVRAARQLTDADLASDKSGVWGHSQGGGAALWTSQEQPSYAPDVPLLGTVAMAPAADPLALARNLDNVTGGSVFGSFVARAYADTYPDLELSDFIRPAALPFVDKLASRCLTEPGVLASVLTSLSLKDQQILSGDPGVGTLGKHLRDNIPRAPGPGPLIIAQGEADTLVASHVIERYVTRLRADGHQVELTTYPDLGHLDLVQQGSALLPELLQWTEDRLASAG